MTCAEWSALCKHAGTIRPSRAADVDEDGLRQLFQSFGIIDSCRVLRNARAQGYGFVKFSQQHEVRDLLLPPCDVPRCRVHGHGSPPVNRDLVWQYVRIAVQSCLCLYVQTCTALSLLQAAHKPQHRSTSGHQT